LDEEQVRKQIRSAIVPARRGNFASLIGARYSVFPTLDALSGRAEYRAHARELNCEAPAPFSFMQSAIQHVGFNGRRSTGHQAFERQSHINGLKTSRI